MGKGGREHPQGRVAVEGRQRPDVIDEAETGPSAGSHLYHDRSVAAHEFGDGHIVVSRQEPGRTGPEVRRQVECA